MKKISLLILFFAFFSCNKKEENDVSKNLKAEVNSNDSLDTKSKSLQNKRDNSDWRDKLLMDYIKNSNNELIKIHRKDQAEIVWLFDQIRTNDSTQFYIYNIGVDVAEEDGSEPRFSSCKWVYLDSVKRILYEYDLPNDTLIKWMK